MVSECRDITLVGEAATFSEAVQKAKELLPDVIVLDQHMAVGAKQLLAGPKLPLMSVNLPAEIAKYFVEFAYNFFCDFSFLRNIHWEKQEPR
jgi:hypothetical protein